MQVSLISSAAGPSLHAVGAHHPHAAQGGGGGGPPAAGSLPPFASPIRAGLRGGGAPGPPVALTPPISGAPHAGGSGAGWQRRLLGRAKGDAAGGGGGGAYGVAVSTSVNVVSLLPPYLPGDPPGQRVLAGSGAGALGSGSGGGAGGSLTAHTQRARGHAYGGGGGGAPTLLFLDARPALRAVAGAYAAAAARCPVGVVAGRAAGALPAAAHTGLPRIAAVGPTREERPE